MNILVVSHDEDLNHKISFALESQLRSTVDRLSDTNAAIPYLLDHQDLSLLVLEGCESLESFLRYLASLDSKIPIIIF